MRSCSCGNGKDYAACCGRFHNNNENAITAELLMRSRYSAYVLGLEDYLLMTWHSSTRPASIDFSEARKTKWLGLEIKRHILINSTRAQVEFIARYRVGGKSAVRLHEISDFVFEDDQWFYVDGIFPA